MRATWPRQSFNGAYDVTSVVVTITQALSLYNSIELLLLIFVTFNKWKGLYFWSLTISTFGVISYCVGLIFEYYQLTALWTGKIFDTAGWMVMVTGQSLVLYSRLGLILANPRILRVVKWMIITDAVLFHGITTILDWGRYTNNQGFDRGYFYIEYIQMTCFCIQEFIISGLYVWKTTKLLKVISKEGIRRVMWQLFTINVVIIFLDIALLAIQYKSLHLMEQTVKAFVYSVKLKLEFSILGKLVEIVQENKRSLSNALGDIETCVDPYKSSPTLHRTISPQSQPEPTPLSEKTSSQQLEHRKYSEIEIQTIVPNGSVEEPRGMPSTESLSTQARRRGARESDVSYAEIMRSLSSK